MKESRLMMSPQARSAGAALFRLNGATAGTIRAERHPSISKNTPPGPTVKSRPGKTWHHLCTVCTIF